MNPRMVAQARQCIDNLLDPDSEIIAEIAMAQAQFQLAPNDGLNHTNPAFWYNQLSAKMADLVHAGEPDPQGVFRALLGIVAVGIQATQAYQRNYPGIEGTECDCPNCTMNRAGLPTMETELDGIKMKTYVVDSPEQLIDILRRLQRGAG